MVQLILVHVRGVALRAQYCQEAFLSHLRTIEVDDKFRLGHDENA